MPKIEIYGVDSLDIPDDPQDLAWWGKWAAHASPHSGPSKHVVAGAECLTALQPYTAQNPRIKEYFGGIGAQAVLADWLLAPRLHVVNEFSEEGVCHLKNQDRRWEVRHVDSYDDPDPRNQWDLVMADFGDLTALRAHEDPQRSALLDRIFRESRNVMITDIAGPRFHLIRKSQERVLGPLDSYQDYLAKYVSYLERRFKTPLVYGSWDRWSTVLAFSSSYPHNGHLSPTPAAATPGILIRK